MGRQLNAEGITGEINVLDNGAYGDGRDDAPGFNRTIAKAQAYGIADVIVPATTPSDYGLASTIVVPRRQLIRGLGATVTWLGATGTAFQVASADNTSWQRGGITGLRLLGQGGVGDTSIGLQVGLAGEYAEGLTFDGLEISLFGQGMVLTSTNGQTFQVSLRDCRIHNNALEGLAISCAAAEMLSLIGGNVFNNGQANGNAGIAFASSGSGAELHLFGTSVDYNGNGTLGQIRMQGAGPNYLFLHGCHLEGGDTQGMPIVEADDPGADVYSAVVNASACFWGDTTAGTKTGQLTKISSGHLCVKGGHVQIQNATAVNGDLFRVGDSNNRDVTAHISGVSFSLPAGTGTYAHGVGTGSDVRFVGNPIHGGPLTGGAGHGVGAGRNLVTDMTGAAGILSPDLSLSGNGTVNTLVVKRLFSGLTGGGSLYIGSGAPTTPNGVNPTAGDYYLRTDTPGTANQRLYVCTVGGATPTWVGIL